MKTIPLLSMNAIFSLRACGAATGRALRSLGVVGLAALALLPAAFAQQKPNAPAKPARSERVTRAQAKLDALTQPPTVVAADSLDDVPPAVADTAQWRLDNAQKLLRTGLWLKQKGETALAADAATKALAQIAAAGNMIDPAKQPELAARRNELAGLIQERLAGNAALARQSYEAAQQLAPGSANLADGRLKRLDKAEGRANTADKGKDKGKDPKPPKG